MVGKIGKSAAKQLAGTLFVNAYERDDLLAIRDKLTLSIMENDVEFRFVFAKDKDNVAFSPIINNETMPTIMMEVVVNKRTGKTKTQKFSN